MNAKCRTIWALSENGILAKILYGDVGKRDKMSRSRMVTFSCLRILWRNVVNALGSISTAKIFLARRDRTLLIIPFPAPKS